MPYILENPAERVFDTLFKKFVDSHCSLDHGAYVSLDTLACAFGTFINDLSISTSHLARIVQRCVKCVIIDERIVCGLQLTTFLTHSEFDARVTRRPQT